MDEDFLVVLKEKTTTTTIQDFSNDGIKVQVNLKGEVNGKYNATHFETSNNFLKIDGTMTWEARAMEITEEGDVIFVNGNGTGEPFRGNEMKIKGELLFLTNSPRLNWLNNTRASVDGIGDPIKGESDFKISRLMQEAPAVIAAPAM
jgi:hypothetical protein